MHKQTDHMTGGAHKATANSPSAERIRKRLTNKALHYLGRYASTSARLETVLRRFAQRKLEQADPAVLETAYKAVIANCIELGYLDDDAFIRSQFRQGLRNGHSQKRILLKLAQKGISRDQALSVLQADDEDVPSGTAAELAAALIYARKKSVGPYSKQLPVAAEDRQKQLGRLARNGFSFDVAQKVMALSCRDEAERLLDELYPRA